MRLSNSDLEKFRQHLSEMEYTCPQCGGVDVHGFTDLYAIPTITPANQTGPHIFEQTRSYALLMASCPKCGLVAFFDPRVVGLFADNAIDDSNQ